MQIIELVVLSIFSKQAEINHMETQNLEKKLNEIRDTLIELEILKN